MSFRKILIFLFCFVSACSAPTTPTVAPTRAVITPPPPTQETEATETPFVTPLPNSISFMVFGEPAEMEAYQILVDRFHEKNPNIPVELIRIPNQFAYRLRVDEDFVLGTPADVMLINYRRFAKFAYKRQLEPLGSYLEKSSVIQPADFYPQTLDAFRWQKQLTCLPQNFSGLVVYFNKELFDAANMPYPNETWTWDDFLDAAKKLTRDTNGDGKNDQHGLGTEANLVRVAPFIWQNGGEIVNNQANPTRLVIDSPAAKETMQWLSELLIKNRVVPDANEEILESFEMRFINGRIGMFINSRRGVGLYREKAKFDWDVAPLPQGKSQANLLQADGYCLAAASEHKESAWKLIEFASSPEGQAILARAGRMVPTLKQVAESDAFLEPQMKPSSSRVFINALDTLRLFPIHPYWWDIEEIAGENLERAFHGDIPVQEALDRAINVTIPFFSKR